MNKLKEKLKTGSSAAGIFLLSGSSTVAEIASLSGFDFVIADCEHGFFNILSIVDSIRAAQRGDCSVVVRVPENNPSFIGKALDAGAEAVQVPQISNRADAEAVVKASKFYPLGERGMAHIVRAAGYSSIPKHEYYSNANDDTVVIIQIEGREGVQNLREILEVEGIDVVFIGPYDLSQSLGVPGQIDHPSVVKEITQIAKMARSKGKWVGIYAEDVQGAEKWRKLGVSYLTCSVDTHCIYTSFNNIAKSLKAEFND